MNELSVIEPIEIDVFDAVAHEDSAAIGSDISSLLESIRNHELRIATGYVRLGRLLLEVQKNKYWLDYGYGSFGQYIDDLKDRVGKQRAQIYNFISVADKLLPYLSESDMEKMGISKAQELARFVKQSGRRVTPKLLDLALDSKRKISELHTAVLEELHEKAEVKGKWYDFGGFFATNDERKEIEQAVNRYKALYPSDDAEHIQRRNTLLAFAQEFVSSNPLEDTQ